MTGFEFSFKFTFKLLSPICNMCNVCVSLYVTQLRRRWKSFLAVGIGGPPESLCSASLHK